MPGDPLVDAYDQIAERFADEAEHNAYNAFYERPATLAMLPDVSGRHVLDAGCGPGIYTRLLGERGARVTAIDASAEMVRLATARAPSATVRRHSLREPLQFLGDASVDIALSALVLDSIEDWRPVMRELARVLVPGGTLVFSVGHPMAELELSATHRYFDVEAIAGEWSSYGVTVPSYRRPLDAIFAPVAEAGFVVERVVEPRPTEECRARFPEAYAKLSARPWFLHVRARHP